MRPAKDVRETAGVARDPYARLRIQHSEPSQGWGTIGA